MTDRPSPQGSLLYDPPLVYGDTTLAVVPLPNNPVYEFTSPSGLTVFGDGGGGSAKLPDWGQLWPRGTK